MTEENDPVVMRHRHLEQIAMAALEVGGILMETGAKAAVVKVGMRKIGAGLGAESVHSRIGYASLTITVTHGNNTITRMLGMGPHGVNMRLNHAVRELCVRVEKGGMSAEQVTAELRALKRDAPRHSRALCAVAAGVACAAFGRLLGVDWAAFLPVLAASAVGQWVRMALHHRGTNIYVLAAIVAFVASALAGLAAIGIGSRMVETAMTAAVLLLVPGVPAMNAQTDIMEGSPTMGSARFVSVGMLLMFITVGMGAARLLVEGGHGDQLDLDLSLVHQTIFGAVAAAGFGVLFNFGLATLLWAAAAGGLALAVRTVGLDLGWSLAAASFVAAAAVALAVELLGTAPARFQRSGNALAVAGCIPMIPGGAAAKCIIGLLGLTAQNTAEAQANLATTISAGLSVAFTIGAIGAGLTIVRSLVRHTDFP